MSEDTNKPSPPSNQQATAFAKSILASQHNPTAQLPQEITYSHRNLILQKLALHSVHVQALINTLKDPDKYVTTHQINYVLVSLSETLDQALNPREIIA